MLDDPKDEGAGRSRSEWVRTWADQSSSRRSDALRRGRGGEDAANRRAESRHVVLEPRAWLGWWAEGELRTAAARLLDISRGGVAIEVDELPSAGLPVLFGLHGPLRAEGMIEATVAGIEPGRSRAHRVRLAFTDACPDALLRGAVYGFRS